MMKWPCLPAVCQCMLHVACCMLHVACCVQHACLHACSIDVACLGLWWHGLLVYHCVCAYCIVHIGSDESFSCYSTEPYVGMYFHACIQVCVCVPACTRLSVWLYIEDLSCDDDKLCGGIRNLIMDRQFFVYS